MSSNASLGVVLLVLACAACSRPVPPPTDRKPEPQAHTGLRDAIQQPLDKARAVEAAVQEAADTQKAEIDAAAGT